MSKELQSQIGGNHYQSMAIQPWEYFTANSNEKEICAACFHNTLKYISRNKHHKITDLKKAVWYLHEWIKVLEAENESTTPSD